MLLSMTGFGDARRETESLHVSVELRAVNNRYLKVITRAPEAFSGFESEVERIVRRSVTRGTVNVAIRTVRVGSADSTRIERTVVEDYWKQLTDISQQIGAPLPADCSFLLSLPNALTDGDETAASVREQWETVAEVLTEAVENFNEFRRTEGRSMTADLKKQCDVIRRELAGIAELAPTVVSGYRQKLLERVGEWLSESGATIAESDVMREIGVFADRCDINEEIKRLQLHIEQFDTFLEEQQSQGRKLEFLIQEMFRETNTIGSKANNVSIAHGVVEVKAAIEKMREMVQNIE